MSGTELKIVLVGGDEASRIFSLVAGQSHRPSRHRNQLAPALPQRYRLPFTGSCPRHSRYHPGAQAVRARPAPLLPTAPAPSQPAPQAQRRHQQAGLQAMSHPCGKLLRSLPTPTA